MDLRQVAAVVIQARRDGVDVTMEHRQFAWSPSSLYYVDGQVRSSTVQVPIFAANRASPALSNGQPERIATEAIARPL